MTLADCRIAFTLLTVIAAQDVFRVSNQTVAIYATVQDRDGRLVPDLTKADFEVLDNGKPTTITTFSNEVLPFTAVMLLDMSNSMI